MKRLESSLRNEFAPIEEAADFQSAPHGNSALFSFFDGQAHVSTGGDITGTLIEIDFISPQNHDSVRVFC